MTITQQGGGAPLRRSAQGLSAARRSTALTSGLALGLCLGFGLIGAAVAPPAAVAKGFDMALDAADCDCDVVVIRVGKAYPIALERPTRDVVISDPKVVDVVLRTAQQPVLFGSKIGQANILFFDEANQQIRAVEVRVEYDSPALNNLIRRQFPKAQVRAESALGEIVLSGTAQSSAEATAIDELARRFVAASRASQQDGAATPTLDPNATGVINRIAIVNEEQVHLQVRVAEVSRSILKELGVDWNAGLQATSISNALDFVDAKLLKNESSVDFGGTASTFIKALEQYSLVHTLAEPSLTAVSGESASFLAGGEFPIPVPTDGAIGIEYKRFGISLDFTPVVQDAGRISLQIATEVSSLSSENSVRLQSVEVPSLVVRRANTTVEVNSGGSLVIAGLIQEDTRRLSSGLPGLRSLPVLGQFFRNENIDRSETELVVMVTPYTVQPGARQDFVLPTDGFAPASDLDVFLFGRLHAVYGAGQSPADHQVRDDVEAVAAPVGYIMQ